MFRRINRPFYYSGVILVLFAVQQAASKTGGFVGRLFAYKNIDPQSLFAFISVHHLVQALIALLIMVACKKLYNITFGFKLGKVRKGLKYVLVFTVVMLVYALVSYVIGYYLGVIEPLNFPLNPRNVLGTLGFQFLLSGPSEEILFRALPITILLLAFGKSIDLKWGISLETTIAGFLFSIAHIKWSLSPFELSFDFYQLVYAFVLGVVYGKVYQKTDSIFYPVLMHSISNVTYVGVGYLFAMNI